MRPASVTAELERWDASRDAAARPTLAASRAYCRQLASTHYENFTVASWLLPRHLRQHFCNVYAYCRWADDLADETAGGQATLDLLDRWEEELLTCYGGTPHHPVLVALSETIREFEIPADPFRQLLVAFRQDQTVVRYQTKAELLAYCRSSANPVGRLVLYLGRCHDDVRGAMADKICTGLQLANFCQDVRRDWERGRLYLPRETYQAAGCREEQLAAGDFNPTWREAVAAQVAEADELLTSGAELVRHLPRELQLDVWLFAAGGRAILQQIRNRGCDVWTTRSTVGKRKQLALLARGWWLRRRGRLNSPAPADGKADS